MPGAARGPPSWSADAAERAAELGGEGLGLVEAGQALPVAQDLGHGSRLAQAGGDRGRLGAGEREDQRLLAFVAGPGLAVEGAAAGLAPALRVAGSAAPSRSESSAP